MKTLTIPKSSTTMNQKMKRNVIRKKILGKLQELLDSGDIFWADEGVEVLSRNIEKSIYNTTVKKCLEKNMLPKWEDPKFMQQYRSIYMKVYFNIFINPCSRRIRRLIQNKQLRVQDIAGMTTQELNPKLEEEAKKKYDPLTFTGMGAKMKEEKSKIQSLHKCGRCKSVAVESVQVQLRSSDEPMHNICTCTNCGNRWKYS